MQSLQDNFFYHSNARLGADGSLRDERRLLVEEQKLCRTRARKFSLETSRRKKALEERRRQWDVQEQRLRENVLQQRRQRVQDATERFQRAHLPLSQRRRQSFRRNVPNVEDALNQIQGTSTSYNHHASLWSSHSNISRSCTPSPKPPSVCKPSYRGALSAVEAYTKLLQDQSGTGLKFQQTESTPEKPQQLCPRDLSDSLSSKDSLESEDKNHSTKNLQSSHSLSFFLDSEKPHPDLRKQNDSGPTSDFSSLVTFLGENLPPSRRLHEPKQEQEDESERPKDKIQVPKTSWGFTSDEQKAKTETKHTPHNCNVLTLCKTISAEPEHFELNSTNNPDDNTVFTNRVATGKAAPQSLCPKQEATLHKLQDDRQLKHPSATEILLPAKNGNSKDIFSLGAPPKPNIVLNDNSTIDNASQNITLMHTGRESHCPSLQKETSASVNNLNKISNLEVKTERPVNAALLQHVSMSNIQSDTHKCLKCPEVESQKLPVSVNEVRFIKGILKKHSKYMSGDGNRARVYGSGNVIFAKQVALAIRDSVELTRAKTKDGESNTNGAKKKLRWFDEVHNVGKEDTKHHDTKQIKGKYSNLYSTILEDHQRSLAGPPFTKQAWADVGVQVDLRGGQEDNVVGLWSSTRHCIGPTAAPPRRERPVSSSQARKGAVIRPQSASEVNQIAQKAQGRVIMAPRPPPRMDPVEEKAMQSIIRAPYGTDHPSATSSKQVLATEQNPESVFSSHRTHHNHIIRTDNGVVYAPLPPTYTCCPVSEGSTREGHGCSSISSSRRRGGGMVSSEKTLCLDVTPTDEEISTLWHGVRTALATKDAKNASRRQSAESGRAGRKPGVDQSGTQTLPENRKSLQVSQTTKQTIDAARPFTNTYNVIFPDEGVQPASRSHPSEVPHDEGPQGGRGETGGETGRGVRQPRGITNISLEEQKVLLSLDRLNHQLYCVREHTGGYPGPRGLVLIAPPSAREVKVTNHQKHRASSANNHSRQQRKY